MHRLHLSRHALPAVLAIIAGLLAPLFAGDGSVRGTAGSATARAAVDTPDAPAPSARFAVEGPAIAAARPVAEQHWGKAPCGGNVVVTWAQLDPDTNATAAWRNPTDAWNNAGENFDCHIEFNADSDYDWPKLCTVMTHEVGHLVGNPHSEAAGELMSPVYSEPLEVCLGPEPGAPAPAAAPEPSADEVAVALAAPKTTVAKKPLRSAATKKKAKTAKRCTRRFSAGRRNLRCAKTSRKVGRAARARRR